MKKLVEIGLDGVTHTVDLHKQSSYQLDFDGVEVFVYVHSDYLYVRSQVTNLVTYYIKHYNFITPFKLVLMRNKQPQDWAQRINDARGELERQERAIKEEAQDG